MLAIKDILNATSGKLLNGNEDIVPLNYEFDSREIKQGTFFVPIKGERNDGHNYIIECVKKGIIGFLIESEYIEKNNIIQESININSNIIIIEVEDTQKSFFAMGKKNREIHIDIPLVAVTGSVGKTSTREMISSVLEMKYNVLKTEKNYNSYLGIPYMLLKIDKQDICVIEVGIDKIGEMQEISMAVKPDVAVITNIGLSHVENFGNIDVTYKEKIQICNNLKPDGYCIVNGDDSKLCEIQKDFKGKIIKYGIKNDDIYKVENIKSKEDMTIFEINNKKAIKTVVINDIGNHNIINAMAGIKVGKIYKIDIDQIIKGISNYRNFEKRMKKTEIKNNCIIINDAYNASYDSVISGLETIDNIKAKKKIVIFGDILELGEYSKDVHIKIGQKIKDMKIDTVITYGSASEYVYNELKDSNLKTYKVKDKIEISDILSKEIEENTLIYIKSSNGMKLYEVSEQLINKYK